MQDKKTILEKMVINRALGYYHNMLKVRIEHCKEMPSVFGEVKPIYQEFYETADRLIKQNNL